MGQKKDEQCSPLQINCYFIYYHNQYYNIINLNNNIKVTNTEQLICRGDHWSS